MKRRSKLFQVNCPDINLLLSKLPLFTRYPHCPITSTYTSHTLYPPDRLLSLTAPHIPVKCTGQFS